MFTNMQRRSFLGLATLTAASTTARLSFATSLADGAKRLAAALERAAVVGKPLLVVVIPEEQADAGRGGRLLGGFLSHAPDADLALLTLCELTCIPRRDLEQKVGSIEDGTFAVLLPTGPPRPELESITWKEIGVEPSLHERAQANTALARRLREVLYTNAEAFQPRAKWNYARLNATGHEGFNFFDMQARYRTEHVDRAAAMLYERAMIIPTERETWMERLANAAAARLWDKDPDGAKWSIDPNPAMHPDPCPPCGMARISPTSRAFLDYYTK
jgi:hypothetical protein